MIEEVNEALTLISQCIDLIKVCMHESDDKTSSVYLLEQAVDKLTKRST